jgi:hypothetical protein
VIAAHTTHSDLPWASWLSGVEPSSLFLCMDFVDIPRLGIFLGALVEALVGVLGSPDSPPRHPSLFVLDEAANLGTLTEIEQGVSHLEGSGVQVLMAFQNLSQIVRTYGPDSPLTAGFRTSVFYAPARGDVRTATAISQALGVGTIAVPSWAQSASTSTTVSSSLSGGEEGGGSVGTSFGRSQSTSQTLSLTGRPLLLPDEVLRLGPSEAIVLAPNSAPVWCEKLGVTPPTTAQRIVLGTLRHRVALATAAGVLLAGLALHPFWDGTVALPGAPVAQTTAPTPPTFFAAAAPLPAPAPLPAAPPATATPPTEAPWALVTQEPDTFGTPRHRVQGRYATEAACTQALAQTYGPVLDRLERLNFLPGHALRMENALHRAPGHLHWITPAINDAPGTHDAWCSTDADAPPPAVVAPPAPALPWRLKLRNAGVDLALHTGSPPVERYATHEACIAGLREQYGGYIAQLKRTEGKMWGPTKVQETPGEVRWSTFMYALTHKDAPRIWCEEDS